MPEDHGYIHRFAQEQLGLGDFGAATLEFLLVRPFKILALLLIALLVSRLGARTIRRAVASFRTRTVLRASSVRAEQRAATIGDVLVSVLQVAIVVVAAFVVLDELGVNLAPLIAGAGIAGVALGFGAQSLVKDVISGLFILLEDQYGVGDVVVLAADATGTVEDVGLRVTRLRAIDGTVWFVPNGEIRKVGNSSMEWSRALIDVRVLYTADLDLVRRVISEAADALAAEETWRSDILEPPELWGVQEMDPDGVTLRLVIKTAPRQQWAVARELRARISAGLRREGVWGADAALPPTPGLPGGGGSERATTS